MLLEHKIINFMMIIARNNTQMNLRINNKTERENKNINTSCVGCLFALNTFQKS